MKLEFVAVMLACALLLSGCVDESQEGVTPTPPLVPADAGSHNNPYQATPSPASASASPTPAQAGTPSGTGSLNAPRQCGTVNFQRTEGGATAISGIYCRPNEPGRIPAVVAVGGYGSAASSTTSVCDFFASGGFLCVGLDSAGYNGLGEAEVIENIHLAANSLKARPDVDPAKLMFWGGSNGALTTLIAASQRTDVLAVAATSPPLFKKYDEGKPFFAGLANLDTYLIYVYAEEDYTDAETGNYLYDVVKSHGKSAAIVLINGAGHEICCGGDERIIGIEYDYFQRVVAAQP